MGTLLTLFMYGLSFAALMLLAWRDPRRLTAARLTHQTNPISGWRRRGLFFIATLPLLYATHQGNWAAALIAMGLLLCMGWGLTLCFAVQRQEKR
jgi:hypothetical protein